MIVPRRLRWLWLTLAVVFLDRATKAWFETQTTEGWRYEVIHNFFYLVNTKNPGIAFSMFANASSPAVRILLIAGALVIIGLIAWLLVAGANVSALNAAGLALLLGGAAGNVVDRIVHGGVTDFLEFYLGTYRYPAFNVADAAITIGAILLVIDVLFGKHRNVAPQVK
jgi:signal peptidase II